MSILDDLADGELHARLTQRGVDPGLADELVDRRDEPEHRAQLAELLDVDE